MPIIGSKISSFFSIFTFSFVVVAGEVAPLTQLDAGLELSEASAFAETDGLGVVWVAVVPFALFVLKWLALLHQQLLTRRGMGSKRRERLVLHDESPRLLSWRGAEDGLKNWRR